MTSRSLLNIWHHTGPDAWHEHEEWGHAHEGGDGCHFHSSVDGKVVPLNLSDEQLERTNARTYGADD